MKIPTRMIIYTQDVMNITGRSRRQSSRLLGEIKQHFNKVTKSHVTIQEFCTHTKLKEEDVRKYLK